MRFSVFIQSDSAGSILLMAAAALAMVLANTPLNRFYDLIITPRCTSGLALWR